MIHIFLQQWNNFINSEASFFLVLLIPIIPFSFLQILAEIESEEDEKRSNEYWAQHPGKYHALKSSMSHIDDVL